MTTIVWSSLEREALFAQWLGAQARLFQLNEASVVLAASDAGFRRYFRVASADGARSFIIMDAPPEQEPCQSFVHVQKILADAQLTVPAILSWDEASGFMLLSDLGQQTLLQWVQAQAPDNLPQAAQAFFEKATDELVVLQKASEPNVLPAYSEEVLRRELALFPEWYLGAYRQHEMTAQQQAGLAKVFDCLVQENLAAPQVFVHRDFMPRNLMMPLQAGAPLGILDFQDALYGPITYDIASLMRDAFWTWDEDFVLDVTVRYWQKARKAGLLASHPEWESDFGLFYRAVDWMALQRHLKVAGIFARLSLRDGKPKYLADTPRFIHYIRVTAGRYRELTPLLRLVDAVENTQVAQAYSFGRL